ncbi:hypothetical protein ACFCW2_05265 [Qipengyuania sp. DSG2-2]|uniref:hypothetical protein n=1 Tax=Qipengyuania sp. DGS2-2 TaxID=3349631 RepID=UPI0036D304DA
MKPPHNRNGRISPWALGLLLAVTLAPIALYLLPDLNRIAEPQSRPPTFGITLLDIDRSVTESPPTLGMELSAESFGTVTRAPAVRAPMVDPRVGRGTSGLAVEPGVARFVRTWPSAFLVDEGIRPEVSTLALRPEDFPGGGRLVLRDGCLRIVKQGWEEERLAVPFQHLDMFRDPEGYLAVGESGGAEEYRLRIGETGGHIMASPVEDEYLEGIAELRQHCGDAPVALLYQVKRLPDCSAEFLRTSEAEGVKYRAAFEAQKEESLACQRGNEERAAKEQQAGGPRTPPVPCPPFLSPPPPPEAVGGDICRHPDTPVPEGP